MDATHSTLKNLHEYRRGIWKAEAVGPERNLKMMGGRTEALDRTLTPSVPSLHLRRVNLQK